MSLTLRRRSLKLALVLTYCYFMRQHWDRPWPTPQYSKSHTLACNNMYPKDTKAINCVTSCLSPTINLNMACQLTNLIDVSTKARLLSREILFQLAEIST